MMVREPIVAGRFYPATCKECLEHIAALTPKAPFESGPARPVAGVVPHAGWFFSGETALAVLGAICDKRMPRTFVIFGAVHSGSVHRSSVFPSGGWQTPMGLAEIDERLAGEILARGSALLADDPQAHEEEHSIEVQVPLVQHLAPEAKIVPIAVMPDVKAAAVGRLVGEVIRSLDADAVCLGSTDLTHYGAPYRFTPQGRGEAALRWMREENDRRMLDLMCRLDADGAVDEAHTHSNACGAGAVAATLAAARVLGAARGTVVQYTTSYDVMLERTGRTDAEAAVGYGGVIF